MLHQVEIAVYVILSIVLVLKGTQRPIWGVGYYMLNFFAQPDYWEWGGPLTNPGVLRWSFYSGLFLLLVTLMQPSKIRFRSNSSINNASLCLILMVINGLMVHFMFAFDPKASWESYVAMAKFALLFFLIVAAVRTPHDFKCLLAFFLLGIGYWGFEAKFVGVTMTDGRLEKFGGPGCAGSNELASIVVTLLPLTAGLLLMTRGARRIATLATAALAMNILMFCNSRGGFVGLMASGLTLPLLTTGKARKIAIGGLLGGLIAFFVLAGNPQVMERLLTTFSDSGTVQDEANKETRKTFWAAGLHLVANKPLGNGGACFKSGMGNPYIAAQGSEEQNRACHQGYIDEAMSWGVQGLLLRLGLLIFTGLAALKTSRFRAKIGDPKVSFVGVSILGGYGAMMTTSLFGDFLQMEWGYWLCITAAAYTKIYGKENYGLVPEALVNAEENASSKSPSRPSPIPAGVS